MSLLCVTFDPWQWLLGVCQEVKGEAVAVNEAKHTNVFVWTVGRRKGEEGVKRVWL